MISQAGARAPLTFDDMESPDDLAPRAPGGNRDNGEGDAAFDAEVAMYSRKGQIAATGAVPETFPCQSCGGSGIWRGGRNQNGESKCFACKGAGRFKTSAGDRYKARAARTQRKAAIISEAQEATVAEYAAEIAALRDFASWSSFAADLLAKFTRYGSLTEGQAQAVRSMMAKQAERKQQRAAEAAPKSGAVDVERIKAMFAKATASGLKKPHFVADGIEFSQAPATGKNPGAVYIKVNSEYAGKILNGAYAATSAAPADTLARLAAVAADPVGEATRYGRLTGRCSCCSRPLSDPESVAAGIGPICSSKWF